MKKLEKFLALHGLTVHYNSYGMVSFITKSKKEVTPRFAGETGLKLWALKNQDKIAQSI